MERIPVSGGCDVLSNFTVTVVLPARLAACVLQTNRKMRRHVNGTDVMPDAEGP